MEMEKEVHGRRKRPEAGSSPSPIPFPLLISPLVPHQLNSSFTQRLTRQRYNVFSGPPELMNLLLQQISDIFHSLFIILCANYKNI